MSTGTVVRTISSTRSSSSSARTIEPPSTYHARRGRLPSFLFSFRARRRRRLRGRRGGNGARVSLFSSLALAAASVSGGMSSCRIVRLTTYTGFPRVRPRHAVLHERRHLVEGLAPHHDDVDRREEVGEPEPPRPTASPGNRARRPAWRGNRRWSSRRTPPSADPRRFQTRRSRAAGMPRERRRRLRAAGEVRGAPGRRNRNRPARRSRLRRSRLRRSTLAREHARREDPCRRRRHRAARRDDVDRGERGKTTREGVPRAFEVKLLTFVLFEQSAERRRADRVQRRGFPPRAKRC